MLKASALYLVIIIALVIGVICSSLIVAAYFYRNEYQKKFRYDQLQNNLNSGVNILLTGADTSFSRGATFSLFNNNADSVTIKRIFWGMYDVGTSIAFVQKDTLCKSFSFGYDLDSTKWAALYLIDEDRPLSVSGKTSIIGDVYIPQAGITSVYFENKIYTGDKRLVLGTKKHSQRALQPLSQERLDQFKNFVQKDQLGDGAIGDTASVSQSYLLPTKYFTFKRKPQNISNIKLSGNIILISDTTITIDSTAKLTDIMVFAKKIVIKSGFQGNCQLFARDTISVDSNCNFGYPSCLGILRWEQPTHTLGPELIRLGNNCIFNGIIFNYEKTESPVKPMIDFGKKIRVTGQLYSQGTLKLKDFTGVNGSIFTKQFLYQDEGTLVQNCLINLTINSKALSPYYLTGDLLPVAGKHKKVLQWLEQK